MAYMERIDFGTRIAGEKAQKPDEYVPFSQITAGTGIELTQAANYDIQINATGVIDNNCGSHTIFTPNPANLVQSTVSPISSDATMILVRSDSIECNGNIYILEYGNGTGGWGIYLVKYNIVTEAYTEVAKITSSASSDNSLAKIGTDLFIIADGEFKKCDCTSDTITDLANLTNAKFINVYDSNIYAVTSYPYDPIKIFKYLHGSDTWEEKAYTSTSGGSSSIYGHNFQYVDGDNWFIGQEEYNDSIRRKYNFTTNTWTIYSELASYYVLDTKQTINIDGDYYILGRTTTGRTYGIVDIDAGIFTPKFVLPFIPHNQNTICYYDGKLYITIAERKDSRKTPMIIWDISEENFDAICNGSSFTTDYLKRSANDFTTFDGSTLATSDVMITEDADDGYSKKKVTLQDIIDLADIPDDYLFRTANDFTTFSSATLATNDIILIEDTDDSYNKKKVTAQDIADLAGGGINPSGTEHQTLRYDATNGWEATSVLKVDDDNNIIGGDNTSIGSGTEYSIIGGGSSNDIGNDSDYSFIGGGQANNIGDETTYSFIGGGGSHDIADNARYSVIVGGDQNNIGNLSFRSFIGGGYSNNIGIGSFSSVIGGGNNNDIGDNADYSVIGGGSSNDIGNDSDYSVISGGYQNDIGIGSFSSVIGGGYDNDIGNYSNYSFIGGGRDNNTSSDSVYSVVVGGRNNDIYGDGGYSSIVGGGYLKIGNGSLGFRGQYDTPAAQLDLSADGNTANFVDVMPRNIAAPSDTIRSLYTEPIWSGATVDDTETEIYLYGDSGRRFVLTNNSAIRFDLHVIARDSSGDIAEYIADGNISRDSTAASTSMNRYSIITKDEDDSTWDFTVDADTTNGALRVKVTGDASNTTKWTVAGRLTEVRY